MYLKQHKKEDEFGISISGYFTKLQSDGKLKICFITEHNDLRTIDEIIKDAGYDPESILERKVIITIED